MRPPAEHSAAMLPEASAAASANPGAAVLAYHQRTKHRLARYAAGPETLDWDAQPDPFRRFTGAPFQSLPLPADGEAVAWNDIFSPGAVAAHAATRQSLGLLLELSFALSAWKEFGPDRWAQRCNPSSGNLHPTEVYLLSRGLADLNDGLYHYAPKEHGLEQRALFGPLAEPSAPTPRLLVGFSSIHWREAWKYGERAFRYCQLDMGHAIGALRYAAAVLGWRVQPVALTHAEIAALLGLDREADFANAEREEPEAVFELILTPAAPEKRQTRPAEAETGVGVGAETETETDASARTSDGDALAGWLAGAIWSGQANRLDRHPMYRWPVIDQVAQASRRTVRPAIESLPPLAARRLLPATEAKAADLIRSRRSAQRFERRARLEADKFWPLLAALMPQTAQGQATIPWDLSPAPPQVHAVLFAHRIDGLAPGAYLLPRHPQALPALQAALSHLAWTPAPGSPADVPLYTLTENPALAGTLRTLSCHQAIGADAVFVVALIAPFHAPIEQAPWHYRELLQEAGLIGQVLYLEAEAAGLRGTGIGCYFDDAVHELLGLMPHQEQIAGMPAAGEDRLATQDATSDGPQPDKLADAWQVLYHFSVGLPVPDTRITSSPPYDKENRP
jgi:SagB-type dehydrogenase family enzyme